MLCRRAKWASGMTLPSAIFSEPAKQQKPSTFTAGTCTAHASCYARGDTKKSTRFDWFALLMQNIVHPTSMAKPCVDISEVFCELQLAWADQHIAAILCRNPQMSMQGQLAIQHPLNIAAPEFVSWVFHFKGTKTLPSFERFCCF